MKKLLIAIAVIIVATACGGDGDAPADKTTTTKPEPKSMVADEPADLSSSPDYAKGIELIGQNDCLTCHKENEKLIGPSYEEVANKYSGQSDAIEVLADKVINGGVGVWGEVPMAPHPNLSKEDAVALVKYIMLLKS